ncbi:dTDP-glucose 4,6-dehydratase [Bacillus cereus]|uniref:dTDP-glucose 4,6-dehydratase n=1 Tax=Bacillus cereus HuA2-1 TaxID=1053201 RepID=J9BKQ2_BACCE|nr:dTDP-glucose 4,6-dehydratase [Bacillus cereus]EJV74137.1 dTDP-glucose 4,6-dehydratase [Bacillus cereus HuA2-1]
MKLLITGGAGFIGSNFIRYILKKYPKYKIFNLDSLTYAGNLQNLYDLEHFNNYNFVKGTIINKPFIFKLFKEEQFDYVLNFAAESHVDRSITDPSLFVNTNIQGTQILLDAALKFNIKKYIQVSTDEVYGEILGNEYFRESSPLLPNNPYSASKAGADMLVRSYYKTFNMPVNITRCSNNYGPFQFPEKLIPLMIINALNDQFLPIYGDGLNIRDWLHVNDHCHAIDLVLHYGKSGEIYNIGANCEQTNIDIVKKILRQLNKPESLIKHIKDRPSHDRRYAIDATKIKVELGWKSFYNFEQGITDTINWYKKNPNWWSNIILR